MEAVVLAGGLGTRLRSIVQDVPKPMAPINGQPFLKILLTTLQKKGFKRVILSVGYQSDKIIKYFGQEILDMELVYSVEEEPLGTGGGTRLALQFATSDHVYVFNGDTFLDLEVNAVEAQWSVNQHNIVVGRYVEDTGRYGKLLVDGNRILDFSEKGVGGAGLINAGCYVLSPATLSKFRPGDAFSIETDFFPKEVTKSETEVFVTSGKFIDIGIPEDYERAQEMLLTA